MTNDYKDEIVRLTRVVRDLTYTIQGATELFVNTNKDLLSSKSIVETAIANKKLNDEECSNWFKSARLEVMNDGLNADLTYYKNVLKGIYGDKETINNLKQELKDIKALVNDYRDMLHLNELKQEEEVIPKEKLKLKTIGIFKNEAVGKALTDKDFADISAPLDLHGLHLNEEMTLENDLNKPYHDKTLIDNISELSKYARRYLRRANIITVSDLLNITENDMDNIKFIGVKTKQEVRDLLASNLIARGN